MVSLDLARDLLEEPVNVYCRRFVNFIQQQQIWSITPI
jgi:hypothetical protein